MLREKNNLASITNDIFSYSCFPPTYHFCFMSNEQPSSCGRNFAFSLLPDLSLGWLICVGLPHCQNWLDKAARPWCSIEEKQAAKVVFTGQWCVPWYHLTISLFFVGAFWLFMGQRLLKASWPWSQCRGWVADSEGSPACTVQTSSSSVSERQEWIGMVWSKLEYSIPCDCFGIELKSLF